MGTYFNIEGTIEVPKWERQKASAGTPAFRPSLLARLEHAGNILMERLDAETCSQHVWEEADAGWGSTSVDANGKTYGYLRDIKATSQAFPDLLFTFNIMCMDDWVDTRVYGYNGKVIEHYPTTTYPDFKMQDHLHQGRDSVENEDHFQAQQDMGGAKLDQRP